LRDLSGNGYAVQTTITQGYELNGNRTVSTTITPTKANRLFIDNITEMWQITDFDDVAHKIVYVKKAGKGASLEVEIKAVPLFFDDFDSSRIYNEYNTHTTAEACFSLIFEDTPYSYVLAGGGFDAVE